METVETKVGVAEFILTADYLDFLYDAQLHPMQHNGRLTFCSQSDVEDNLRGFSVRQAPHIVERYWPNIAPYHFSRFVDLSSIKSFAQLFRSQPLFFEKTLELAVLMSIFETEMYRMDKYEEPRFGSLYRYDLDFLKGLKNFMSELSCGCGQLALSDLVETPHIPYR